MHETLTIGLHFVQFTPTIRAVRSVETR